jgi:hypothetical protein
MGGQGLGRLVLGAALAAGLTGCVDRRFIITTDPPTAVVEVNGKPLPGATPADQQFTYYGTYRFVIKREGYEPLIVDQPVPPPWYEYPPLDFLSENLLPFTIRDVRHFHYPLRPLASVPAEAVLSRAQELRAQGQLLGKPGPAPQPVVPAEVPPASNVPPGSIPLPAPRPLPPPAPPSGTVPPPPPPPLPPSGVAPAPPVPPGS